MHHLFRDYGPEKPVPTAIMASGLGTLTAAALGRTINQVEINLVITDRECGAEDVAKQHGVKLVRVDRGDFGHGESFDRMAWTVAVQKTLVEHRVALVASMGLDTVLHSWIFTNAGGFGGRILNSHPARIPGFEGPGKQQIQATIDSGATETDATFHVMSPKIDDAAKVLVRIPVPVFPEDDVESLHNRIKGVERPAYPWVIESYVAGHFGY